MLDVSNKDLVRRAQKGDVHAIGELYDRHQEQIFRFVWSRVGNRQLAEDITGEVFTRMVVSLSDYELTSKPFHTPNDPTESTDGGTVTICHKPGTPTEKTMTLPQSALSGHLGHGDTRGACP